MTTPPDIRAARPEEAEAVLETLCLAFGLDTDAARPLFYADPYYDLLLKRVLTLPGTGVVSCLTVVPARLRIGGVLVPAAGVAGVATRPAFQRRGHAATLLTATVLTLYAELGFPLALLHPISAPFYERLGWEYASRQVRWLAPPSALPHASEANCVRPLAAADWPAVHRLNDTLTRSQTGSFARDRRRERLLEMPVPGREAFVYEGGGEIAGWGIWERQEVLHLLEMRGQTPAARRGLVGCLANQPDPIIEWMTSPAQLADFGLSSLGLAPEPGIMLRIADLEAALDALHPAHFAPILSEVGTTLTVTAADPLCPQNTRPLRLTAHGIFPGTESSGPSIHADIRVLARLYLGDLLPSDAAASGLLSADGPQTLVLADRLFPLREPYVAPLDQF